jgi:hypothetical protein
MPLSRAKIDFQPREYGRWTSSHMQSFAIQHTLSFLGDSYLFVGTVSKEWLTMFKIAHKTRRVTRIETREQLLWLYSKPTIESPYYLVKNMDEGLLKQCIRDHLICFLFDEDWFPVFCDECDERVQCVATVVYEWYDVLANDKYIELYHLLSKTMWFSQAYFVEVAASVGIAAKNLLKLCAFQLQEDDLVFEAICRHDNLELAQFMLPNLYMSFEEMEEIAIAEGGESVFLWLTSLHQ